MPYRGNRLVALQCPLMAAASTGRCNTSVESFCRRFELQCFAWPLVQLPGHFVQMSLRVYRQVGSLALRVVGACYGARPGSPMAHGMCWDDVVGVSGFKKRYFENYHKL